jgi:hypothetical protein
MAEFVGHRYADCLDRRMVSRDMQSDPSGKSGLGAGRLAAGLCGNRNKPSILPQAPQASLFCGAFAVR